MNEQPMVIEENGYASNAMAQGRALQQVRTTYATAVAVQKPRKLPEVQRRLLDEARLAGEDFYYGWGAGKDRVEGASKELACAMARCWGNCAIETLPVQDVGDSWIFTAAFVDLETGFTMTRQFRQSKNWKVHGKLDDERKADIRFQIGQSKAIRNVILNSLPPSLINQALLEAKSGVREKIEQFVADKGLPAAVDMVIRALIKCGVKEPIICDKFGVAERSGLSIENLVILRGDLAAIEGGQERPESLFPALAPADKPEPGAMGSRAAEVLQKAKGPAKPETAPPAARQTPPAMVEGEVAPDDPEGEEGLKDSAAQYLLDKLAACSAADLGDWSAELSHRSAWLGKERREKLTNAHKERLAALKSAPANEPASPPARPLGERRNRTF